MRDVQGAAGPHQAGSPQAPRSTIGMWLVAGALFAVSFTYYFGYTDQLSFNGGPDEEPHYHAARFIDQHQRLAVYPDDEALLYFSSHGTTRSFRPPLAYLTGVGAANLLDGFGIKEKVRYRVGAALSGALTVSLVFLAAAVFSGAVWVGLFCAVSFGLLPQFTFLAVYFNDDVTAVMSVALLLFGLVLMLRRGTHLSHLIVVGVAAGLIVISKPSAWPVAFGMLPALSWLALRDGVGLRRTLLVVMPAALAIGGWWIAFNLYQHGLNDPLNWEVERALGVKHRVLPPGVGLSYAAQGVTLAQLLGNYDNFLVETYKSAVGNLDWLRLEMGRLQYGFYAVLLVLAGAGAVWSWISPRRPPALARGMVIVFLISIGLQIAAYFWVNLHRDSQAQGRYLLPAAPILMLLLAGFLVRALHSGSGGWARHPTAGGIVTVAVAGVLLAAPVYVHLNGLVHRVLPFYKLDYYHQLEPEKFARLPQGWNDDVQAHQLEIHPLRGPGVRIKSSGHDPWFVLNHAHTGWFDDGVLVRVTLESQANGRFAAYWDEGRGMNEALSAHRHFNIGYQIIYLHLDTKDPQTVRIDPLAGAGDLIIYEIAVASVERKPLTILGFLTDWLGFGGGGRGV